jgi:hypothetical protein
MGDSGAAERAKKRGEAEKRAASEAARQAETAGQEKTRELEKRLKRSCHRGWVLVDMTTFPGSCLGTLILFSATALGVALYSIWQKPTSPDVGVEWWVAAASAALVAAVVLLLVAVNAQIRAAWGREQAWLVGLPFQLDGYREAIGTVWEESKLELRVTFEGGALELVPEARALLAKVDPGGAAGHENDVLALTVSVLGQKGDDRVTSVRAARLLFRDVVDEVLRPLGAKRRVVRVEVRS